MEVFPDQGDIDMWRSLKLYRALGYLYMLMPEVAFAFAYGYIRAMIQSAEAADAEP